MDTDERNKLKVDCLQKSRFRFFLLCRLGFFPSFFLIHVHPCESVVPNLNHQKNRGERPIPGCGAGMETLCRVNDGATGGDERRHIASAQHRGSEGAQAISMNPLRNHLLPKAASDRSF
jgi:hypothetical protein